jgi:hypothetical protein
MSAASSFAPASKRQIAALTKMVAAENKVRAANGVGTMLVVPDRLLVTRRGGRTYYLAGTDSDLPARDVDYRFYLVYSAFGSVYGDWVSADLIRDLGL